MFYIIYKTTNKINGKVYVGCHKTANLDDGYLGSGKYFKRALEKYGQENFEREVLQSFSDAEGMFSAEAAVVNEDFVKSDQTYNLTLGGSGSWYRCNEEGKNIYEGRDIQCRINFVKAQERQRELMEDPEFRAAAGKIRSKGLKINFEDGGVNGFNGKTHSDETKATIGKKNSEIQKGSGNSHFGTCWIHHTALQESKRVPAGECDVWIELGWIKGRKIKWD